MLSVPRLHRLKKKTHRSTTVTSEHRGNGTIFHSLWSDPVGDQSRNLPVSGGTLDPKGSTVTAGQQHNSSSEFCCCCPTSSFCMAVAQTGESSSTPTSSGAADCMITRLLKLNWHQLHKSTGRLLKGFPHSSFGTPLPL